MRCAFCTENAMNLRTHQGQPEQLGAQGARCTDIVIRIVPSGVRKNFPLADALCDSPIE